MRETSLDNDRCQSQYEALYKQFMASGAQKEEPSPTQAVKKTSPSSSAKPQQVRQLQMPAVAVGGEPAAAAVAASNSLGLSSSTQAAGAVVEQPAPVPANEVVPAHVQSGHVVSLSLVTRTTARILLGHKLSKSRLKDFIFNHQFKCLKETLEPTLFNQNCHTDMEFMFFNI